jgi:hypothetical protein
VAKAGEFLYVPPGHDTWVVGDEPYVLLPIIGGRNYAAWSGRKARIERTRGNVDEGKER